MRSIATLLMCTFLLSCQHPNEQQLEEIQTAVIIKNSQENAQQDRWIEEVKMNKIDNEHQQEMLFKLHEQVQEIHRRLDQIQGIVERMDQEAK